MHTLEAIQTRRSIRRYTEKKIDQKDLNDILRAAMMAPSAHNQQPWQFIIIDDSEILKQVPSLNSHASMCTHSPVSILICADTAKLPAPDFWPQDCAAATQNLMLAAHAQGIGSVWTGIYPKEQRIIGYRKLLNLPDTIAPFALIVLGYPAEQPKKEDRFDAKKIHHNDW